MSLLKILDLISFIHQRDSSIQAISRFLVLDTFSDIGAVGISMGLPSDEGETIISSNFGVEEFLDLTSSLTPAFLLRAHVDGLVQFSKEEILSANKTHTSNAKIFPLGFRYTIESPSRYSQTGIIFFREELKISPEIESIIRAAATLVASHNANILSSESASLSENTVGATGATGAAGITGAAGAAGAAGSAGNKGNKGDKGEQGEKGEKGEKGETGGNAGNASNGDKDFSRNTQVLTSRQEVILEGIRRGKSNAKIADDLNYSESLIRQEAIEIYRKMGISGRSALMTSEPPERIS